MERSLKEMGKIIKNKREELNLSQLELAKKIGYKTSGAITRIEKGERDLPIDKLKLLANAINTSPEYLIGWEKTNIDSYYVDTSMLSDKQLMELDTLLTFNVAMLKKSGELTETDEKTIKKAITETFINTLPKKE